MSSSDLPLVIVNPRSASGATSDKWAAAASEIRTNLGAFSVEFTEYAGHAIELAENAARSGREFIIACGGDGTINEVANGIIRSKTNAELGVLPSGTGGDFRRTLGLPASIRRSAAELRSGTTASIDAARVTFASGTGTDITRYFVNISSIGLPAAVIRRVKTGSSLSWIPISGVRGKANFAVSALQEVIDLEPSTVRVKIDGGQAKTLQTICLCVANARYFGGGMMVAPDALIGDGLLDVVNIGDMTAWKIFANVLSIYRGTHLGLDEVRETRVKTIEIAAAESGSEILLETDGETLGKLPALFEVVPNALRVRLPRSARSLS